MVLKLESETPEGGLLPNFLLNAVTSHRHLHSNAFVIPACDQVEYKVPWGGWPGLQAVEVKHLLTLPQSGFTGPRTTWELLSCCQILPDTSGCRLNHSLRIHEEVEALESEGTSGAVLQAGRAFPL